MNWENKKEILKEVITLFEKVKLPTPHRIFKSYPHQLSGGQKQRLSIARELFKEVDILPRFAKVFEQT